MLGDVHTAIGKLDSAMLAADHLGARLDASTKALTTATEDYRSQIDDTAARLRAETSVMLKQSSEHAAKAMVGMQTAVLQEAATNAVRKAVHDGLSSRLYTYAVISVIVSGLVSAAIVVAVLKLV